MTAAEQTSQEIALQPHLLKDLATQSGWSEESVAAGNVLVTNDYFRQISPYHLVKIEALQINVPAKKWDSTDDLYTEQNGKFAPTKHLLERIALKAGIRWDVNRCGIVGPATPDHVMYRAVGGIRGLNGEWVWIEKVKEWQLDVELLEIEERAAKLTKGYNAEKRDATPEEKASYIRMETARAKKHRLSMIESKAKNRVIKSLLGLPSSADATYWRKRMFVPRIDLHLDPHDPEVKRRLLDEAHGASNLLGYEPIAPVPAETTPTPDDPALEAEDVEVLDEQPPANVDQATGEVQDAPDPLADAAAAAEPEPETPAEPEPDAALEAFEAAWMEASEVKIPFGETYIDQTLHEVWKSGDAGKEYVKRLRQLPTESHGEIRAAAELYVSGHERKAQADA